MNEVATLTADALSFEAGALAGPTLEMRARLGGASLLDDLRPTRTLEEMIAEERQRPDSMALSTLLFRQRLRGAQGAA